MEQRKQKIAQHIAKQKMIGLKGPIQTFNYRLFSSMLFFNEVEKFYLMQKIINTTDALNFENHSDIIISNYKLYLQRLQGLPYFVCPKIIPKIDAEGIFLVMMRQALKQTLEERLSSKMEIYDNELFWIVSQILFELSLMHSIRLPHCNLATSNVLLSHNGNIYLTDFGMVMPHFFKFQDFNIASLFVSKGTNQCYIAPERFTKTQRTKFIQLENQNNSKEIDLLLKSDVFAVASIIYRIITRGKTLFDIEKLNKFSEASDYKEFLQNDLSKISNIKIRDLITEMLNPDYTSRISMAEAFSKWNQIFVVSPQKDLFTFFYVNFLCRHKNFSMIDHQIFLSATFLTLASQNNLFGLHQTQWRGSHIECLGIVFKRIHELLAGSNIDEFMELSKNVFLENSSTEDSIDHEIKLTFFEKSIEFINHITIKSPPPKLFSDIINEQIKTQKVIKKDYYQDSKKRKREAFEKIFNNIKNFEISEKSPIVSIMLKAIAQTLTDCESEEAINLGLYCITSYCSAMDPKEILIFIVPCLLNALKQNNSKICRIKFLKALIKTLKCIKFLDSAKFSKLYSIETYIFVIVEYIMDTNDDILLFALIKNFKTFIKVCYVINISGILALEKCSNLIEITQNKRFLETSLKIKQYFILKFETLLENNNLKSLMLKQMRKFIYYFDENFVIKNIMKLIIKYLSVGECNTDALISFPLLFSNQSQITRVFFPVLKNLLKSEREEVLIAVLTSMESIIRNFEYNDCILFKDVLDDIHILIKRNMNSPLIDIRIQKIFKAIFERLSEEELNAYFLETLRYLTGSSISFNNVKKADVEKIIMRLSKTHSIIENASPAKLFKHQSIQSSFFTSIKNVQPEYMVRPNYPLLQVQNRNIILELYKFLFSLWGIELASKSEKSEFKLKDSFDEALKDICKLYQQISEVNLDLETREQNIKFSLFDIFLSDLEARIKNSTFSSSSHVYNREKALLIIRNMLQFSQINKLKQFNVKAENRFVIDSSLLRQMRPKGNIKATLFDSKSAVKCLAQKKGGIFFAGNDKGEIFTYNLNKLHKNDEPSLLEHKFAFEKKSAIKKIIVDENNNILIAKNDPKIALYDPVTAKVEAEWVGLESAIPNDIKFLEKDNDSHRDAFLVADNEGSLSLFDLRQKRKALSCKLNPLIGTPSCMTENFRLLNQFYVGTHRGFLVRYDVRMNLLNECFRLNKGSSFLPITSVSEFIPSTEFQNFSRNEDYLTLTYPSMNNEFSIFNVGSDDSSYFGRIPRIHFIAENTKGHEQDVQITDPPYLMLYDIQKIINIKEDFKFNSCTILKELALKKKIYQNNPKMYLTILDSYFNNFINESKLDAISKIVQENDCLLKLSTYDQSIRKILTFPSRPAMQQFSNIALDNIIITAGDDRNIRFLNFGNSLIQTKLMRKSYSSMKCYLIVNNDFQERSYYYHYSANACIVKESSGKLAFKNKTIDKVQNAFGISEYNLDADTENGLSAFHNYNFGNKLNFKQQSFGKSWATPCHELAINDVLLVYHNNFNLISCSEDGFIKIWE